MGLINNNNLKNMLRYMTDETDRQTDIRPGLVAFYVIRPENGAGLFLQPQNPHEANAWTKRPNI